MIQEFLNIALFQLDLLWEDPQGNRDQIDQLFQKLDKSTDVVFLPEMFTTGFSMNVEKLAETMNGKTIQWMKNRSAELQLAMGGSLIIQEKNHYFNRFVFVQPSGEINFYNKRHLFTMGNEESHFEKGTERLVVQYKGWRICPLICYDIRFPVWSRNRKDYDLLVFSANWPANRDEVWNTLLKARAIENQAYVAGVNRVGADGLQIHYSGYSQILNAKGNCLSNALEGEDGIVSAKISYSDLENFRVSFPVWDDADPFNL